MWQKLRQLGLATLVVSAGAFGCHRSAVRDKNPPPDPLLVSKKPVEGRGHGEPRSTVRGEVPPPAPPGDFATVSSPAEPSPLRPARLLGVQPQQ